MTKRDRYLRRKYGITELQYADLLARGNGACWLCKRKPKPGKNLHVDHEHVKGGGGKVRGLLDPYCNRRVIGRHRSSDLFRAAAAYLDGGTEFSTPRARRRPRKAKRKRK